AADEDRRGVPGGHPAVDRDPGQGDQPRDRAGSPDRGRFRTPAGRARWPLNSSQGRTRGRKPPPSPNVGGAQANQASYWLPQDWGAGGSPRVSSWHLAPRRPREPVTTLGARAMTNPPTVGFIGLGKMGGP